MKIEKLKKNGTISHQGENGGKPPKFKNEQELENATSRYINELQTGMLNKAGLRAYVGISRETYGEYKKKYPDTIKRFENLVENQWVQRLAANNPTGAIFYLKNAFKEDFKTRF